MRVRDKSDASDKPIFIDFISGFVHNSSLVTPYNLTKSQPERWESYIYHTAPATTLEHCAALCQITVTTVGWTCNIFSWDATTCYLANHNKVTSSNINGPPGLSEIYITPCMFPNILTHIMCAAVTVPLQPSYLLRSHPSWSWRMWHQPAFQGMLFRGDIINIIFETIRPTLSPPDSLRNHIRPLEQHQWHPVWKITFSVPWIPPYFM